MCVRARTRARVCVCVCVCVCVDSRLTTAWNCMTNLVTTLIVLIQNYFFKEIFLSGKCYKFSPISHVQSLEN